MCPNLTFAPSRTAIRAHVQPRTMETGLHRNPAHMNQHSYQRLPEPPQTPNRLRRRRHTVLHVTDSGSPILTPVELTPVPTPSSIRESRNKNKQQNFSFSSPSTNNLRNSPGSGSPSSYSTPPPHHPPRSNTAPPDAPPRSASKQVGLALTSDERVEIPEAGYRLRHLSRYSLIPGVGAQLKVADDADGYIYGESRGGDIDRGASWRSNRRIEDVREVSRLKINDGAKSVDIII
ncbi:hypothetical protein DM02DRAFT_81434 [Periconia macrospinosa]|uniref:Uncharacterized protein n=1 Tax=Periconia macrospinosa TaxID=97972 RepID=A0A2V1DHG7_9PLEO|nr:hypothetical protein DM02DRAFT_81434 [Periconia macrospinosa]